MLPSMNPNLLYDNKSNFITRIHKVHFFIPTRWILLCTTPGTSEEERYKVWSESIFFVMVLRLEGIK